MYCGAIALQARIGTAHNDKAKITTRPNMSATFNSSAPFELTVSIVFAYMSSMEKLRMDIKSKCGQPQKQQRYNEA
jgi:hypothetical protein